MTNEQIRLKNNHRQYSIILGVDHYGQASQKLYKTVLLDLAKKLNKEKCTKCQKKIELDTLSLNHRIPWRKTFTELGNADLFWQVDNIDLQCRSCNNSERSSNGKEKLYFPIEFKSNQNVNTKTTKDALNFAYELLGMDFGKANHKLFRKVMFEWCKQTGLCNCYRCGKSINKIDDWTIEHKKEWLSGETDEEKRNLFFNLDNIAYSHIHCNCSASGLGKGVSGYNGVCWHVDKRTGYSCWRSRIMIDGRSISGLHNEDLIKVAESYDLLVLKYRNGEGMLNFPEKLDQYKKQIEEGWGEPPKCKICGAEHDANGLCRKCNYHLNGGIEKRKIQYQKWKEKQKQLKLELSNIV